MPLFTRRLNCYAKLFLRKLVHLFHNRGDYDGALEIMGEVVQSKQARLENVQAANALWLEIEGLLSNTL